MKSLVLALAGILLLLFSGLLLRSSQADRKPDALLRHVVLFKFKSEATETQVQEIVDDLKALPNQIQEIHSFEWGLNHSTEGRSKGLTHCFLLTFKSQADLDAYLPHPAHAAFVRKALPLIEDVTVVDYWTAQ